MQSLVTAERGGACATRRALHERNCCLYNLTLPRKSASNGGALALGSYKHNRRRDLMTNRHRLIAVSLLSTTFLTGCVVWKSDYDKLQTQNQQLQQKVAADQQQISRLQGAIK